MIPYRLSYSTINKARTQVHLFRRYKLGNILTFWGPLSIGPRITLILRNLKHVSFRLRHMENQSVQSLGHIWLLTTPWTEAYQGLPIRCHSWSLLKLTSIELVMPYNRLILSFTKDSSWYHRLQHNMLPCPSLTPEAYLNSCPSSLWCHPTISSSVIPFSSHFQCFLASGSFPLSQFFSSSGQSIGVSVSASVLPMNIQDWFPLGLTESPCSPRNSQESSPTPLFKSINSQVLSFLYSPTLTSIHECISQLVANGQTQSIETY